MRDSSGSRTQVFVDPPGYSVRRAEANSRTALSRSSAFNEVLIRNLDGGDPDTIFQMELDGGAPGDTYPIMVGIVYNGTL
jgi:hypothetical protein